MGPNLPDDDPQPFVQLQSAGWFPRLVMSELAGDVVMMVPCCKGVGWKLPLRSIRLSNELKLLNPLPRRRLTCFSVLEITKFGVILAQ